VNPPGYRDLETLVLPMLDNTIAAARAVGVRIVLPGNVYNFGPYALPAPTEESPQHPLLDGGTAACAARKTASRSRPPYPLVPRSGAGSGQAWRH
ncbi:hypothetical protein ACC733_37425, partial [Rhizobium johnstonii]